MAGSLTPAALGFRAHAGWVAVVCLAGPQHSPSAIERMRLLLTKGSLPCEPYHWAKSHDLQEAQAIVRAAADEAQALAVEGMKGLIAQLDDRGYEPVASGVVLGSGRPDFTLKQALSTHAAMHNAEGWLCRHALFHASREFGLNAIGVLERDLHAQAATAIGAPAEVVRKRIAEMGASIGPPWTVDQKVAAVAAWIALPR